MIGNLSRREKVLLMILMVIMVIGLYYYFIYQPIRVEQEALENEIINLQNQYQEIISRVEAIPDLETELVALKEERQELLEAAIREPEEILAAINLFARNSNVSLREYQKREATDGHPFSVSLRADYMSMLNFTRMVDNWDYRLVVENFSIVTEGEKNQELRTEMQLFFHQPDDLVEFIQESGE